MFLVVDTNVIVAALKTNSKNSKSYLLMKDIFSRKHIMCISEQIMDEYEDVLNRSYLKLNKNRVAYILAWIRISSFWIEPKESTPEEFSMIDESDRIFFDVAKCLKVKLVTHNLKHYPVHELITKIDELY